MVSFYFNVELFIHLLITLINYVHDLSLFSFAEFVRMMMSSKKWAINILLIQIYIL